MAIKLQLFSSVTQLCPTLCNPMACSTPGLPVHHQLPESAQTHVHWVGDAIQPSHSLSSPSPPAFPSIRIFSNESVLCNRWPKYWSINFKISPSNEYSGLISLRMEWLDCLEKISPVIFRFSLYHHPVFELVPHCLKYILPKAVRINDAENNRLWRTQVGVPFSKHVVYYSIQISSFRMMGNTFYD